MTATTRTDDGDEDKDTQFTVTDDGKLEKNDDNESAEFEEMNFDE